MYRDKELDELRRLVKECFVDVAETFVTYEAICLSDSCEPPEYCGELIGTGSTGYGRVNRKAWKINCTV